MNIPNLEGPDYYEEAFVEGDYCFRTAPDGSWAPVPRGQLVRYLMDAQQTMSDNTKARIAAAVDRKMSPAVGSYSNHPNW